MFKIFKFRKNSEVSNHKISYKTEIFCISILTVVLIFLGWAYILQESDKYKESITNSFSSGQEALVDQAEKNIKERIELYSGDPGYSAEQAEDAAVSDVIGNSGVSNSRYWFFYASDRVIFEKDAETSRNLRGRTLPELVRYWKLQGGSGMEVFEEMLSDRRNGSSVFSKDNETGNETVSVKYFTAGGRGYFLGMSTIQSYVVSTTRVNEHVLYLWTFSSLVSLDILIFSLLLCLRIYRHQKESEKLNRSIVDKSLQIQELSSKLASKNEAVQNASIFDSLTKLYNRKFFDNLMMRVSHDLLQPVSIVVLDINGLDWLNSTNGYEAGDELLERTSEILRRVCIDTDVVARTGSSEFTILMTGTKEAQAYGTAENIKRQFSNLDNGGLTLALGVAQMNPRENNVYLLLQTACKNLILDKLMDEKSNSNTMVSMLMSTLKAFSREAVEHCDRLKTMAVSFGRLLGLSPSEISRLAISAQLHDVGKVGIPDSILNKKGALDQQEWELIRRHPEVGYNIINAVPFLDETAIDVYQHHEHYNGKGYPQGLAGDEISLNARIISIIDSFDAMTHDSVYGSAGTIEDVINELRRKGGSQYDPYLVNEFVKGIENGLYRKNEEQQ